MPFYRKNNETGNFDIAPNWVSGDGYDLNIDLKDTYEYPVAGWYWYDTLDEAIKGFATEVQPVVSITMRQARLQLYVLGLLSTVNSAVATMGEAAQIEWEYAAVVEKSNPLITAMAGMLGWTAEQTDEYFNQASLL